MVSCEGEQGVRYPWCSDARHSKHVSNCKAAVKKPARVERLAEEIDEEPLSRRIE